MGKKSPYYGKSMIINFPDFPHTMSFAASSYTVGNLWRNPCISHMLKYTIGWGLDGKKPPILWEKYDYWFPILFPAMGFVVFSHTVGNIWRNPSISHMMTSVNFFLWLVLVKVKTLFFKFFKNLKIHAVILSSFKNEL